MLSEVFASAVGIFVDRYRSETDAWAEALLHRVAEAVGPWILARSDTFALLHGDYRADNLLIDPDGTVTAVDWQTTAVGHPGRDLAYFCETSVEPEIRGSAEDQLVAAYRDGLAEHQVVIGRDEAFDIYRFGLFQGPLITVLGAVYATAERSARADAMFLTMLQRSLTAIDDLDPFELI
jgi:aminoglycoside phosphotransferase (APT) family kinase protein